MFTLEILFVALAAVGVGGMFYLSRHSARLGGTASVYADYALALFAWLPVWVFTHLLWKAIAPSAIGYPFLWFWLVFVLGCVVFALALVPQLENVPTLRITQVIGVVLVGLAFYYTDYFAPRGGIGMFSSLTHTLFSIAVIMGVVALAVFVAFWVFKTLKIALLAAAPIVAIVLVFVMIGAFSAPSGDKGKPVEAANVTTTTTVTATPSAPPYHQRSASQCDAGFNVKWDKNVENDLVTGGIPRNKFPTAESAIKKLVDVMRNDSRVLAIYYMYSPEQKLSPITGERELRGTGTNDGCYSAKGQQVFNAMVTEFAHAKLLNVQSPTVGVNTGAIPGGSAFQEPAGQITGNRDSVKITYENGASVNALRRCGNLQAPGPIPNTPVKPPTTPPGNVTTPPGNVTTPPGGTSTPPSSTPPTGCVPTPGVESCGKHVTYAPKPTGGPVETAPAGGYRDRSGAPHSSAYTPPPNTNPDPGRSSAGPGATNTTTAPTPSATATAPKSSSPTGNPVAPPPPGT